VKALNIDKALGLDNFSMAFFQACWDVLKEDIMNVLIFHAKGMFENSLNATFIALIPKKSGAIDIKDFRPFSLVGGIYKIVVKVLANRLKMVVEKIISNPQNAIMKAQKFLLLGRCFVI
jgi:hypothetical protein